MYFLFCTTPSTLSTHYKQQIYDHAQVSLDTEQIKGPSLSLVTLLNILHFPHFPCEGDPSDTDINTVSF